MEVQITKTETCRLTEHQARDVTLKYLQTLLGPGDSIGEYDGVKYLVNLHRDERTADYIRIANQIDISAVTLINFIRSQP